MQLDIGRINLGRRLKIFDRLRILHAAIEAKAQQNACLLILRVSGQGSAERRDRRLEVALLELCQAQIQLYPRQLGIQGKGLFIGDGSLVKFLQLGEEDSHTGKGSSFLGSPLDDPTPDLNRFF